VLRIGTAPFLVAYVGFASATAHFVLLLLASLAAGVAIGCIETAEHTAVAALAPRGPRVGLRQRGRRPDRSVGSLAASGVAGRCWPWCRR
jgi:hypothetical protein